MLETAEEMTWLQNLLDSSFDRASEHLMSIMTSQRRLSARRLVDELPSPAVLNIATVTARGEPRVSAVDGHLMHGRWYWTTAAASPKARQLAVRAPISASYTPRDGFGVFCHGQAAFLGPGSERRMIDDHFTATYGQSPSEWGVDIAYVRIDPSWMVGFAMTEEEMVAIEAAKARSD